MWNRVKKRLALTYPNQRWQKEDANTVWDLNPATLCLLAAVVKDIVEVKIIDAQFYDLSEAAFADALRAFAPDYVGISVMTSEYRDILDIAASIAKKVAPDAVVIAGGVHVTTNHEYVMRNRNIDYCVRGEGENVLRELLAHLNGDGALPQEGLIFRKGDSLVVQNQAITKDLQKLPWPDYGLIKYQDYLERAPRFGPNRPPAIPYVRMNTTRGCPFGCSFCQVEHISGKKVRSRDPNDVVDELFFLKEKYGIKSILFDDDNMLMGRDQYAKRLFTLMAERDLGLKWVGTAFALFLLTDELLDLMARSGCVGVNVAIESGTERVLKQIVKKPIKKLSMVPEIIARIKSKGLFCFANFIIGFPGETWDEIRETIRFAETCGADYVKFFLAVPLYGTPLYEEARKAGALVHHDEYPKVDWRFGQIKSEEWTPKDISILRAYEWDRVNFSKERIERTAELWGLTPAKLEEIRKKTRDNLVF